MDKRKVIFAVSMLAICVLGGFILGLLVGVGYMEEQQPQIPIVEAYITGEERDFVHLTLFDADGGRSEITAHKGDGGNISKEGYNDGWNDAVNETNRRMLLMMAHTDMMVEEIGTIYRGTGFFPEGYFTKKSCEIVSYYYDEIYILKKGNGGF